MLVFFLYVTYNSIICMSISMYIMEYTNPKNLIVKLSAVLYYTSF